MTFKLNMTDDEANSKDYELPPTGLYVCRVTDISLEEVKKAGDNFGKPFWKMTLTVDDGPYAGVPVFAVIMLFDGALYTLRQLCEAVHPEYVDGNNINLPSLENGMPDPDPWMGQIVNIKGTKFLAGTKRNNGEYREYDEFKIRFKKPVATSGKAGVSGLPLPA